MAAKKKAQSSTKKAVVSIKSTSNSGVALEPRIEQPANQGTSADEVYAAEASQKIVEIVPAIASIKSNVTDIQKIASGAKSNKNTSAERNEENSSQQQQAVKQKQSKSKQITVSDDVVQAKASEGKRKKKGRRSMKAQKRSITSKPQSNSRQNVREERKPESSSSSKASANKQENRQEKSQVSSEEWGNVFDVNIGTVQEALEAANVSADITQAWACELSDYANEAAAELLSKSERFWSCKTADDFIDFYGEITDSLINESVKHTSRFSELGAEYARALEPLIARFFSLSEQYANSISEKE